MKVTTSTPSERTVTIEMTEDEAESLVMICECIGGHPNTTRRGHLDSLKRELKAAHINHPDEELKPNASIWFKDRA